eukprot:9118285-Alexandrium_andersonii.AAC.1
MSLGPEGRHELLRRLAQPGVAEVGSDADLVLPRKHHDKQRIEYNRNFETLSHNVTHTRFFYSAGWPPLQPPNQIGRSLCEVPGTRKHT